MFYLCFPTKSEFKFESSGKFITAQPALHPRRRLLSAVILFGITGTCPIFQNGVQFYLESGSFMLLLPQKEHFGSSLSSRSQSHFWCHFYLPENCEIIEYCGKNPPKKEGFLCLPEFGYVKDKAPYFLLFRQLIDTQYGNIADSNVKADICDSYVKIILQNLSCTWRASLPHDNITARTLTASQIKEYLRLHFKEKITSDGLSEVFNYNSDYLAQIFKKETGTTISHYITTLKMQEAKSLLLNSNMKIYEIADAIGYGDSKYFMRQFKASQNITPGEFRRAYFNVHTNIK